MGLFLLLVILLGFQSWGPVSSGVLGVMYGVQRIWRVASFRDDSVSFWKADDNTGSLPGSLEGLNSSYSLPRKRVATRHLKYLLTVQPPSSWLLSQLLTLHICGLAGAKVSRGILYRISGPLHSLLSLTPHRRTPLSSALFPSSHHCHSPGRPQPITLCLTTASRLTPKKKPGVTFPYTPLLPGIFALES